MLRVRTHPGEVLAMHPLGLSSADPDQRLQGLRSVKPICVQEIGTDAGGLDAMAA